jgi:hypothetical protein
MSPSHCCPTLVHPLPLWGRCGSGDGLLPSPGHLFCPFCEIQPPNTSMICLIKEHSLLDTLPEDRTHYGMILALLNAWCLPCSVLLFLYEMRACTTGASATLDYSRTRYIMYRNHICADILRWNPMTLSYLPRTLG